MKRRFKILTQSLATLFAIPSFVFPLSACHKKMDKVTEKIYEDTIKEFFAFSKSCERRATFNTKTACVYICNRVAEIMGWDEEEAQENIHTDWDNYKSMMELNYFKGDAPEGLGCNIYFDIDPAVGCENFPTIIIQCHTDMVWTTKEGGQNIPKHPEPVFDFLNNKKIIRSKGLLTSLGADNGIGVATSLALVKNRDLYPHGKIRFLMTTDEEDGPSGARFVPPNWLQEENANNETSWIKYLINIDLEDSYNICESSAGFVQTTWTKKLETTSQGNETIGTIGWRLEVSGLKGGHSAKEINKQRMNSVRLGAKILTALVNSFRSEFIQLYRFYEVEKPSSDIEFPKINTNVIPNHLVLCFATNVADKNRLLSVINETIKQELNEYPGENPDDIGVDLQQGTLQKNPEPYWPTGGTIITSETEKLASFLTALPFGPIGQEILRPNSPKSSNNIGGLRLLAQTEEGKGEPGEVVLEIMGRSVEKDVLGEKDPTMGHLDEDDWDGFMALYRDTAIDVWGKEDHGEFNPYAYGAFWKSQEDSVLHNCILNAGRKNGYSMQNYNEHSWLELSEFSKHSHNIDISAIGPTIANAHSINEFLEVDSIIPMIKILTYTFKNIERGE